MKRESIRKVLMTTGPGNSWLLELWDTMRTDWRGKSILAYCLTAPNNEVIFEGDDFCGSPLHADDSDETLRSLMTFLTLRKGDTDAEYFENYTRGQLWFRDNEAEYLSMWAMEEDGEPFEEVEID